MSTATSNDSHQLDLVHEVAALKRKIAKLLDRLEQPTSEAADYTIKEWRAKRNISHAGFYKMRNAGRAPRIIENNGLRRITREADREWEAKYSTSQTD